MPQIDGWINSFPPGVAGTITVLSLGDSLASCGGHTVSTVIDYFGGSPITVPGDNGACIDELQSGHSEALAPGAAIVADMFSWTPGSTRVIIPAGDEPPCNGVPLGPPGTCQQKDVDAINNLISVAGAKDVHILPIAGTDSSDAPGCTIDLWDLAADQTGSPTALHVQDFAHYGELGEALVSALGEMFAGPSGTCLICQECDLGPCPWDLDEDNQVGVSDLLALLGLWGTCVDPEDCPGDFNCDGTVGVADLLILLGEWGPQRCTLGLKEDAPEDVYDCMERYEAGTEQFEKCIEWVEERENYLD